MIKDLDPTWSGERDNVYNLIIPASVIGIVVSAPGDCPRLKITYMPAPGGYVPLRTRVKLAWRLLRMREVKP